MADDRPLSSALVGMAASVMIRRHFSGQDDVRAITAYVAELCGPGAPRRGRLAEAIIRSELGEPELAVGLPQQEAEAFVIVSAILFDLVRRHRLNPAQVESLVAAAERDAQTVREFVAGKRLSVRGYLTRGLRRRAGVAGKAWSRGGST